MLLALCRVSPYGILIGQILEDRENVLRFPACVRDFSLLQMVQDGGVHPPSCLLGTRDSFIGTEACGT
jgi:hypothetical protein